MNTALIEDARAFAIRRHGSQRYGQKPYHVHLQDVYDVTVEFNLPEEYRVAAWMHDLLEDTNTTVNEILIAFGDAVYKLVWAVTGVGKTRYARNESIYGNLTDYPLGIPLKLCDRIANTRACLAENRPDLFDMYAKEYPRFRDKLRPLTEKNNVLYKGPACPALWDALDLLFARSAI